MIDAVISKLCVTEACVCFSYLAVVLELFFFFFLHKEGSKGKKIYKFYTCIYTSFILELKGAFSSVKANPTISAVGAFLLNLVTREALGRSPVG